MTTITTNIPDPAMCAYIVRGLTRHALRMRKDDPFITTNHPGALLAIACRDVEPRLPEQLASVNFAVAIHAIKNWPGLYDSDALAIVEPEPSETESDRLELVAQRRNSLKASRGMPANEEGDTLSMPHWKRVIASIQVSKSIWAAVASDWLIATLVTGLRPREWCHAKFVGESLVVNQTHSAHANTEEKATRSINLSALPKELALVTHFLRTMQNLDDADFKRRYEGVRSLIRTAAKRTFPKFEAAISIDTARKHFLNQIGSVGCLGSSFRPEISRIDVREAIATGTNTGIPINLLDSHQELGATWIRALMVQAQLFQGRIEGGI